MDEDAKYINTANTNNANSAAEQLQKQAIQTLQMIWFGGWPTSQVGIYSVHFSRNRFKGVPQNNLN